MSSQKARAPASRMVCMSAIVVPMSTPGMYIPPVRAISSPYRFMRATRCGEPSAGRGPSAMTTDFAPP